MALNYIMMGAQLGLGLGQSLLGDGDDGSSQAIFEGTFRNSMTRYKNEKIEAAYRAAIEGARAQMGRNREAANRAWADEQVRLNEEFQKAAFIKAGMMQKLAETQGTNNAREVYGASARRAALISSLGEYGRANTQLAASLYSASQASRRRMRDTAIDLENANLQTFARVATAPTLEMEAPMYMPTNPNAGLNTALSIASAGVGAMKMGWDFTAGGGDFFGVKKPQ